MNQNDTFPRRERLEELLLESRTHTLSDIERKDLNTILRTNETARAFAAQTLMDDTALTEDLRTLHVESVLAAGSAGVPGEARSASEVAREPRLQWRPLAAAAAGILAGTLSTSVVFGYVMPRYEKAVTLLTESFETDAGTHGAGFPRAPGVWGGDPAQVVEGDGLVTVKDGVRMLRMGAVTTDLWNRQFFMVDLSKLPTMRDGRARVVRVVASFHASASEIRDRYLARAATFAEGPESIRPEWMTTLWGSEENRALAMAAKAQTFRPGTFGWQTLQLTLDVPQGSRVLVLSFWTATMHGKAELRAAHFLDDVRVSLDTLPPTP